jgi:tryptophanyl-tRNA synthetase
MTVPPPSPEPASGLSFPPRIVSGVQPSPRLHLGHYFGAIENLIRLQHAYPGDTFYLIADYCTLTHGTARQTLPAETLELATALLALGLDPNKAILYRQSDLPECLELTWYLSCLTSRSILLRNPPPHHTDEDGTGSAGTFLYPLLMAADVLALRGTVIATGHDQQANARLARDVAQRANRAFGHQVFPPPEARFSGDHVVPGTDGRKMSVRHRNFVDLFLPYYSLKEQVASIVTDSKGIGEPKDPDTCTVYRLYSLVATAEEREALADRYRRGGMGYEEAKRELVRALQEFFAEAAECYADLTKRPDFVLDVLREGVRQAQEEARYTLDTVRDLFGIAA